MTTPHLPVDEIDDIIELTEIIEEGTPPAALPIAADKAVDAKSLDDELDALLSDAAPLGAQDLSDTDDLDLDALFAAEAAAATRPAPSTQDAAPSPASHDMDLASLGEDLSDLDQLFDALKNAPDDATEHNALDALLLGDGPEDSGVTPDASKTSANALPDDLDIDLALPGLEEPPTPANTASPAPEIAELNDLLDDLPMPEITPSDIAPAPAASKPENMLHAEDTLAEDILADDLGSDLDLPGLLDPVPSLAEPAQAPARLPSLNSTQYQPHRAHQRHRAH